MNQSATDIDNSIDQSLMNIDVPMDMKSFPKNVLSPSSQFNFKDGPNRYDSATGDDMDGPAPHLSSLNPSLGHKEDMTRNAN